jgi:hypothetical protein
LPPLTVSAPHQDLTIGLCVGPYGGPRRPPQGPGFRGHAPRNPETLTRTRIPKPDRGGGGANKKLILYEKGIRLRNSGNEVYHSIFKTLLVKNMLCSKLHCQHGFNFIPFSYKTYPCTPFLSPPLNFWYKVKTPRSFNTAN